MEAPPTGGAACRHWLQRRLAPTGAPEASPQRQWLAWTGAPPAWRPKAAPRRAWDGARPRGVRHLRRRRGLRPVGQRARPLRGGPPQWCAPQRRLCWRHPWASQATSFRPRLGWANGQARAAGPWPRAAGDIGGPSSPTPRASVPVHAAPRRLPVKALRAIEARASPEWLPPQAAAQAAPRESAAAPKRRLRRPSGGAPLQQGGPTARCGRSHCPLAWTAKPVAARGEVERDCRRRAAVHRREWPKGHGEGVPAQRRPAASSAVRAAGRRR